MANWVREILEANPELAALPVAKRARRSLHLLRPDGKTLGLFTGGPIHYRDEQDEWQPLDTMPLYDVGRGLWYCPGLNVVITPEGVVRLGDYSQWTKRVGLFRPSTMQLLGTRDVPLGSRVGDTLVAEGDWWRVERRITPTGYRELLTLKERPSIPQAKGGDYLVLETLIGGVSLPNGWVGGRYNISEHWSPLPVAWDADNEPLTCRRYWRDGVLYTGIPVTELASAAYPVIIDPDFTGDTADGHVYGEDADYATARSATYASGMGGEFFTCGQYWSGSTYYIHRGFLKFDTSGIGPGQTITQVNLNMTVKVNQSTDDEFDVQIVKQDWSAQDPIVIGNQEAAYDNCLAGTADDAIWRNTIGIAVDTNYTSGNLDTTWPEMEGDTYYSLRSDRDKDGTAPPGLERLLIYAKENVDDVPYLTIEYSVGNGEATVEAVVATATAAALLASITAGAIVSGELATASAAALVPTVSGGTGTTVAAVVATATAEALVPTVSGGTGVTVIAVVATATAAGLVAVVTGGTGATVSAVVAEAAAAALLATVTGGATVSAEIATATAEALIPVVTGDEGVAGQVDAVTATAVAAALLPTITGGAIVVAVVATATAEALAPQIIIGTVVTGTPIALSRALVEYVLSNGLLANAEADVYEVPVFRQAIMLLLLLHNIHESNDNTFFLFLQRSGQSSLRVAKKNLAAGETAFAEAEVDEELVLNTGDKIRAYATNANEVTWTVSMQERVRV